MKRASDATRKLEAEFDWSDAQILHRAADLADEQDVTSVARLGIVRM
jgi:hypothetical protein